jgi:molybdopterin biosynthesis enzyme MoaB
MIYSIEAVGKNKQKEMEGLQEIMRYPTITTTTTTTTITSSSTLKTSIFTYYFSISRYKIAMINNSKAAVK